VGKNCLDSLCASRLCPPLKRRQSQRIGNSGEFENSLLERLRRQQLADLARAYDLLDEGFDPNWPKPRMLSFLKRYESEMLFHKPPKREFYFMRAGR
jgi:hypothetical protein